MAALAAVAVPLGLPGGGQDSDRTGGVASDPTSGAAFGVTFLDYLDLRPGLGGRTERGETLDPGRDECLADHLPVTRAAGVLDVASITMARPSSVDARRRAVLSYDTAAEARAALAGLTTAARTCAGVSDLDATEGRLSYTVRPDGRGDATLLRVARIDDYLVADAADLSSADPAGSDVARAAALDEEAAPLEADLRGMGDRPAPDDLVLPAGIGPVGLGIGTAALEALPGLRYTGTADDAGCRPFAVTVDDRRITGVVGPEEVEEVAFSGTRTPAGIGVGSTAAEVRAAHPRSTTIGTRITTPAEPGGERVYDLTLRDDACR